MLNYQFTKGEEIALVFIHGYCEDLTMWSAFSSIFEKHSVLAVDLPGFGKSATYDGLSIESMAVDVEEVIRHLEIEACILIGHSMGGYVSVALSRLIESQLKGICMFHSHPFEDLPVTKEKRTKAIAFVQEFGVRKFAALLVPTFFAPALKIKYAEKINEMIAEASLLSIAGVVNGMLAMRDKPDMQSWVAQLSCPYQCILGTEDIPTPLDFCLPQVSLANTTKLDVLEGIGHMGMFSATQECQTALGTFIEYCGNA